MTIGRAPPSLGRSGFGALAATSQVLDMLDVDGIDADPNAVELRVLSELPELLCLGLLGPLAARPAKQSFLPPTEVDAEGLRAPKHILEEAEELQGQKISAASSPWGIPFPSAWKEEFWLQQVKASPADRYLSCRHHYEAQAHSP